MDPTFINQAIPVILLLFYFLYPCRFEIISQTILGKCIAVFILIFYTYQDMTYGLIVCVLFILFYELVNSPLPLCKRTQQKLQHVKEKQETFLSDYTQEYEKYISKPSTKQPSAGFENYLPNDFTSVHFAYPEKEKYYPKEGEALFRKEKCVANQVEHKGIVVKYGHLPHIYDEFSFEDEPCNPCDLHCHFHIQEKKEETKQLLESQNTRGGMLDSIKTILFFSEKSP